MKKLISLILALLLFSLCACSAGTQEFTPDSAAKLSEETLNEKLIGLSSEQVHEMWGQPDSFLSGISGDIYLLSKDRRMIIILYDADGFVNGYSITEQQTK